MADFWKSLPRKFCDTCKCWFADNKASIEFHEKGKRHQENVQRRVSELQKKGQKEYERQVKYESEMEKIEKAALEAYKKDLQNNPELLSRLKQKQEDSAVPEVISPVSPSASSECPKPASPISPSPASPVSTSPVSCASPKPTVTKSQTKSQESFTELTPSSKLWYEAVSPEGYHYYWNIETGESKWEPPTEGYLSLEDQQQSYEQPSQEKGEEIPQKEESDGDENIVEESLKKKKDEEKEDEINEEELENSFGPQPKPDPYGAWEPVEQKEEQEPMDLQLPERSENYIQASITLTSEPKVKFKEKTVSKLSGEWGCEDSSGFKKRKNINSAKRNVRQRIDDE